jgi:replication factor C small subunit
MAAIARPEELKSVLETAIAGDFSKAKSLITDVMLKYALSGIDVVKQIQREVWELDIDNRKKVELIERCGDIEFRLTEGSDDFVQIEALLASVVKAGI